MDKFQVTTPPSNFPEDRSSRLSLFDRHSPDRNLFNSIDEENIKMSGSEILVYKYTPSDEYDEVYMESRRKAISPEPISTWGHYDPRPIEENLGQFGVEVQNDQIFIFNKSYIERTIGRAIIPGDILNPVFQNMKFEVFEVQEDSFEAYGIYHLMVHAKLLRDTQDIHNEHTFDRSESVGGKL